MYVIVSSDEEEHIVRMEERLDIIPLRLDLATVRLEWLTYYYRESLINKYLQALSSPSEIHPALHEIRTRITQPQSPSPGVAPHICQLSGLVIVPSPHYAAGPVATIAPSMWADTTNTRLLIPILTTELFLPLLTLRNTSSTIVLAYPSIASSLSSPFSAPEVAMTRALAGFAASLRRELRLLQHSNVDVVELRLGNIDLGHRGQVSGSEVFGWTARQRALYASQYMSSIEQRPVTSAGPSAIRGSPARNLHYAVFDAIDVSPKNLFGKRRSKKGVIYVGRGARSYQFIGDWMPDGLVGLMLGLRTQRGSFVGAQSTGGGGGGSEAGWEKV